jgi:hypothetical protein
MLGAQIKAAEIRVIMESPPMALEKEWYDRSEAIRTAIVQLRDSL